jgi:signal transduction histidine kinase
MSNRLLFVEDDLDLRAFATKALVEGGFTVEGASSAAEAVRLFELRRPDLVIMDIGLPDCSGIEACKAMGLGSTVDTPFLFLTARDDLGTRMDAFAVGAHDYIQKPFSVEELLARVRVHLRIKRLHDDLNRRNFDLELLNKARRDVTDMIVHDLKTPLTSISGVLQLIKLRRLPLEEGLAKLLEGAGAASDFMLLMVNDLLDVGRAETAGLKVERGPVDLQALLAEVKRLFSLREERSGIALILRVEPGLDSLTSDHNLIFRIIVNLTANAMKISTRGSTVEVEAARRGPGVVFSVLDRGPGVPDALKREIFEKYSSGQPKSLKEDGGTGIGLTFCRLAAQALGGRVWVEDRPGGGSAFRLELEKA